MKAILAWLLLTFVIASAAHIDVDSLFKPVQKPYTLRMLNMMLLRLEESVKTSELLTRIVNSRTDILPDYNLEVQLEEEDYGRLASVKVINFMRQFDDATYNVTQSPIVVGPFFSTGCRMIGRFAHHVNQVVIATTCTSPVLSEHHLFPNLYLTQTTDKYTAQPILHFIREYGKWNKIAIISHTGSVNDYSNALFIHQKATEANFTIIWFDLVDGEMSDTVISSLKSSDARIVVAYMSIGYMSYTFLCQAYKFGMTGPKYVFIMNYESVMNPSDYPTLPITCNERTIVAQMPSCFWFGLTTKSFDADSPTELGYSQRQFVQALREMTNGKVLSDHVSAHDSLLLAIMALNATETKLKALNLSLRDYARFPVLVSKIANESVLESRVKGTRIGLMTYSKGGLPDRDNKVIGYWSENEKKLIDLAYLKQKPNSIDFAYESYYIEWFPKNRNLPQFVLPRYDSRIVLKVKTTVSRNMFISVIVISIIILLPYGYIAIRLWKNPNKLLIGFYGLLAIGCAGLNGASCLFSANSGENQATWQASVITAILALSLIHGTLVGYFFGLRYAMPKFAQLKKSSIRLPSGSKLTQIRSVAPAFGEEAFSTSFDPGNLFSKKATLITTASALTFFVLNIAALLVWFVALKGVVCYDKMYLHEDVSEMDVLHEYWQFSCGSALGGLKISIWLLIFAIFHMFVLLAGCAQAYHIAKNREFRTVHKIYQTQLTAWCLVNGLTLAVAGLLVMFILNGQSAAQKITISYLGLLESAVITIISVLRKDNM